MNKKEIRDRIAVSDSYKGYDYKVVEYPQGWRCGYVRIPSKHKLYGKDYSHSVKTPKNFDIEKESVGKRSVMSAILSSSTREGETSLVALFDVHGGLTFSGRYPELGRGWWLGFDCMHLGDKVDRSIMSEEYKIMEDLLSVHGLGVVRDRDYVIGECKNLIDQIIKYFD